MVLVSEIGQGADLSILGGAVCAVGVFDGIHEGHRFLIHEARLLADELDARCVCITFDIDPDERFASDLRKLMSNERRIEELSYAGFDDVVVLRFTEGFSALSADDFLEALFRDALPAAIVVAEDFRFGAGARGDLKTLEDWSRKTGVRVVALRLLESEGVPITSTRIRALLARGDVQGAERLLGHPFSFASKVLPGRQAGRDMGFRTANMGIPSELFVLKDGVYAAYARIGDSIHKAGVSVGISPTFEEEAHANVEAHVLDFDGDLYGQEIEILFKERIRDMRKFDDRDELIATINADFATVRNILD